MSDPNNGNPPPGAGDVLAAALTKAGFSGEEAGALLDQFVASRAAPAPAPAPRAPSTTSTTAGATAQRTYSLDELKSIASTLGLGGAASPVASAAAAAPAGPPITSRAAPPPAGQPTDDTPILSMGEADRKALAAKMGDVKFAERLLKEVVRDRVRVRGRDLV